MAATQNRIAFWRGTRAQYEALGENTSPNTYYTVKEADGRWTSFYGPQMVVSRPGQLMPADGLLEVADFNSDVKDAMVIGKTKYVIHDPEKTITGLDYPADYTGYFEIVKRVDGRFEVIFLEKGVSVRIGGNNLYKSYQVTDNGFRTYDDTDCGEY